MSSNGRILYIDRYGAVLGAKEGVFEVRAKENGEWKTLAKVPFSVVEAIVIAVEGVSITAAAIKLAGRYGIDLSFIFSNKPVARLIPATYGGSMELWAKQIKQSINKARRAEIAKSIVEGKINNQKAVLKTFMKTSATSGKEIPEVREAVKQLEQKIEKVKRTNDWREAGKVEANAAYIYWKAVKKLVPKKLGFERRLKKWDLKPGEKPDPLNAALNVGYAALAREVWKATFAAGLNPYIGFLHARRPGRMSLVYDLMEEFRPVVVDRIAIKKARNEPQELFKLNSDREDERREAVKALWRDINEWLKMSKPPLSNLIMQQSRKFAKAIRDKTIYVPFKAKW